MHRRFEPSRRTFLGAAGAAGLAALRQPAQAVGTTPPSLSSPNILLIMVDQLRAPMWLTSAQNSLLDTQVLPNIFGRIRDNAVVFNNYFVCATTCTASRSTLLTGLYAPQTCMYQTSSGAPAPSLNPAFPTWGGAIAKLNAAYKGNVWWFGKWHLSRFTAAPNPLLMYGFVTRNYPSASNPSPDGWPNEGANGGAFGSTYWAKDADIANDFTGWLSKQAAGPWCATVSFVNPHDISDFPAWFPPSPYPPTNVPLGQVYFAPPAAPPANYLLSSLPSPWNYENPSQIQAKQIWLQTQFLNATNQAQGSVNSWLYLLNWYYWLQNYVDAQVKTVLDALQNSPFANNTVVIFTSDHGEYGGSHGLHSKGGGVYDEIMRVPLYVCFPGMTGISNRWQMCSSVDVFGLMCDLATTGGGLWASQYPDLANRESIYNFMYNPALPEQKRIVPGLNLPYIFHTVDNSLIPPTPSGKFHATCLRTKNNPSNPNTGAKYAVYNQWASCSTLPDPTVTPDQEFYDYTNKQNRGEVGNDFLNPGSATAALIAQYQAAMGSFGVPGTGLIGSELTKPLVGTGMDGNPLTTAQANARQNYLTWLNGSGVCS